MMFQLPNKDPVKSNSMPKTARFVVMSGIEALFNEDGTIKEFKVLWSSKQMAKEDRKVKEDKKEVQRKVQLEEDEVI